MSYVLTTGVLRSGTETITVAGGGAATGVSITDAAASKANDRILVSLNRQGHADIQVNALPYVYSISEGAGFDLAFMVENIGVPDLDVLIYWAVIR